MARKKLTKKTRRNLKILGVVLLLIGGASLVKNCSNVDDSGLVEINPKFSIGGLQENTGKYEESEYTLYTKNAFECEGLEITADFDSEVNYQVFFYDESGAFVSATEVLDGNYRDEVPAFATHARLELTPVFAPDVKQEDRKLTWYNYRQYTDDITIRVAEKTDEVEHNIISENLFEYAGIGDYSGGVFTEDSSTNKMISTTMDITAYDRLLITIPYSMYSNNNTMRIMAREGSNGTLTIKDDSWVDLDVELRNSKVSFVFEVGDAKSLVIMEMNNVTSLDDFKAIEVYGIE